MAIFGPDTGTDTGGVYTPPSIGNPLQVYAGTGAQDQQALATTPNNPAPAGSPAGTTGGTVPYQNTASQLKSFTFRYEQTAPPANAQNSTNTFITLFVNPEEFTVTEPYRITVTQTKGGAFVDNFGQGIRNITIRGVTGYAPRKISSGVQLSGEQHFIQIRNMFRLWADNVLKDGAQYHKLYFYNWQDNDQYEIVVNNFSLLRSVGRPLLYQYNMALTCVRDLGAKPSINNAVTTTGEQAMQNYLGQSTTRPPLVLNKISGNLSLLNQIITGLGDMSSMSIGTQMIAPLIPGGLQYFNTVSGAFETINSVIFATTALRNDLNSFVTGSESFIRTPYQIVRNLTQSMSDATDSLCVVTNVPHEIVRIFRDLICAIRVLSPNSFTGFTNPTLFEGASNCGTTLGIQDAPVASTSNSFEATAQVPQQLLISQVFIAPQAALTLTQTPLSVNGVYIETDVSRTGLNYLQSFSGNQVTLTSIPTVPVVVDYTVQQNITTNQIVLQASQVASVLVDDTLDRIAVRYYGDPTNWKLIALFNNLEYPYIVSSDFVEQIQATGYVRFYRDPTVHSVIIIPNGTPVWVPAYFGTNEIDFVTTAIGTMAVGVQYIDVPVQAALYGEIGNVSPQRITDFNVITGISKIANASSTFNGKIWNVVKPGDKLQIPLTQSSNNSLVVPSDPTYEQLYGVDIALNTKGEFDSVTESNNDMRLIYGADNLVQAIRNRIATTKGFYVYHLTYGTNLPYYIGKKNVPYWQELAKSDVQEACLLDPRISDIDSLSMVVNGDVIYFTCTATAINESSSVPVSIVV